MEPVRLDSPGLRGTDGKMIYALKGMTPKIDPSAYIVESATIIGDVVIGKRSSVWFNAVVRGDVNSIRIGERTNIQDGCILHVQHKEYPLVVGSNVTVGHAAILHGCVVEDFCLIGMGAKVLNNARIGHHTLIAAGAVVREQSRFSEGVLLAGVPAKVIRKLTNEERENIEKSADHYVEYVNMYR
jgi:carbonic anhydrase/acetyltransferase-like protein (isoleucine patch superfamily)